MQARLKSKLFKSCGHATLIGKYPSYWAGRATNLPLPCKLHGQTHKVLLNGKWWQIYTDEWELIDC